MDNSSNKSKLFESILDVITEQPKHFLCFMLFSICLACSIVVLILSWFIGFTINFFRLPRILIATFGILLIMLSAVLDHNSVSSLMMVNHYLFHQLVSDRIPGITFYDVLASFPYSIFLGAVWSWLLATEQTVRTEVKRVSKGRLSEKKVLSQRKLDEILCNIRNAALPGRTVLGVNMHTGQSAILTDEDANLHTLVVGTTGSGKTTTLINIIESMVIRRWPLFYIDGKGDQALADRVKKFASAKNIPFYGFSMVGESVHYNPIATGGFTSKKDRIVALRHWSEEHYKKIAEGYLQTVLKLLDEANIKLDLYSLSAYLSPNRLYQLAREQNRSDWIPLIERLEDNQKDIQSLIAEIENIANSEIGSLFDTKNCVSVTLEQVLHEKGIFYCCLQPLCFPSYAETIGKLVINDLKSLMAMQLQRDQKENISVIFDEFSIFAGEQIINLINQGRSAGVHAVLATQSLADIEKKGGKPLLSQIINNTNNYIIQRQNNPSDAECLANIIGTYDDFEVTSQVSVQKGGTGVGSVRQTKAFIVHPDSIKRLKKGEAIYVNKQNFKINQVKIRYGSYKNESMQ